MARRHRVVAIGDIEPSAPLEKVQQPGVDIAPVVAAQVDDQRFALVDMGILADEAGKIGLVRRRQMNVAYGPTAQLLDEGRIAGRPRLAAQPRLVTGAYRHDVFLDNPPVRRSHLQYNRLADAAIK